MKQRVMAVLIFTAVLTLSVSAYAEDVIRIGVAAMISPRETAKYYTDMVMYVGQKIGKKVEIVQKENYAEMDNLLEKREVNVAFLCAGPYVNNHEKFGAELLVAPQSYGKPFYHAYIIAHKDSPIKSLDGLKGKKFAFTDPKSNTGKLVPTYMVAKKFNETPETFFSSIIYSKSHDKSVEMVAKKLADGASIDSLIYDYAVKKNPTYTQLTKIIEKSPPYGIPPVVVNRGLESKLREALKNAFLNMHNDPKGKAILAGIMVDKFIVPKDSDYNSVREMEKFLSRAQK
ncbi:MAG: phosphate/phosphite/phosphonate ABC transporter substrate-binding protein [Nitrospirae bacterium]|nr:phosphate/phosphite/phosphonate ABC transporter substrate-binding protein [Nitrospirota bacterium]